MKFSNGFLGFLNFLTLVLSVPILGGGIWLAHRAASECEKYLHTPVIMAGALLFAVSLAGIIGACCRVNWLLWLYLIVMFIMIVVLLFFTVFAFVITNQGAGEALSNRGYKEYKLGDYSNWLQERVTNNHKSWNRIKSCLIDGKVCKNLAKDNKTKAQEYFTQDLSPIESGCCKPPDSCNFTYQMPTVWTEKNSTAATFNPDCDIWSNNSTTLCFNCESCKAGLLQNLKSHWKRVAIINILFLLLIIVVYSIGCCAFHNNRWENSHSHPRQRKWKQPLYAR